MDLSSRIQNFFNSKKKQLGQAVQQAPQQLQSFGENLLKPQNITNAVTNIGSFFAPQTKPFIQSKPIQNVMTGMATGLSNTVKEGLPAAYRISPLNPQRSPLKINNGQLGFNLFNTPTMPSIKQDISDTFKAGKLAATVYGIPKLTAGSLLASGGLGGGLNKLFGGSFSEGAGQGLSSAPVLSGIGSVTNPLISNVSSRLASGVNNPLGKLAVDRVATGVMNIPEGLVMKGALTNNPYDITDAGLDFGMGLLGGSGINSGLKNSLDSKLPNKIPPNTVIKSSKASTLTALDDLLSVKVEPQESLNNASELISKANSGKASARGPIKVMQLSNNKYIVIDGNATTQTLKQQGYSHTPTEIVDRSTLGLQDASDEQVISAVKRIHELESGINNLVNKAKEFDPVFKTKVNEIGNELGLKIHHGNIKTGESIIRKTITENNGDLNELKDPIRTTILIDNPANLQTVVSKVKEKFGNIHRLKDKFGNKGYKSAIVNVKLDNGVYAEVQITTPEMFDAKTSKGGHKLYQKVRIKAAGWEEFDKQMNDLYLEADNLFSQRLNASANKGSTDARVLNSSKDISSPSDRALSGEYPKPVSSTFPNTSSPFESTMTNVSLTSKNRGNFDDVIDGTPFKSTIPQNGVNVKQGGSLKNVANQSFYDINGKTYKQGEEVGFAGILSPEGEARKGKLVRKVNDHLVEVDYGDHVEQNHVKNIFKLNEDTPRVAQESISDTKLIPSEVVKKQPVTPKEFIPSKKWQEYTPDQTLPIGMEVKMENGKQYARIPEGENVSSVKQIMDNRQSPLGSTLPPGGRDLDSSSNVVEQVFKTKKFNVTKEGAEMLDEQRKDLGFDVRKVKHFDEMKTEGKELQGDLRSLLKRNKNDIVTDSEVSALSDVASTSTDRILKLTKQLDQDPSNTTIKKQIEIEEALLDQVLAKQIKGGTAAGRAVVAFRILANKTLDRNFWINKAKKQLGDDKKLNAQVIGKIDELVKSKDRIGLAVYIGKLGESTFGEKAVGLWKASLLTGFRTHEANMLGNEIMRNLETVKDIPATMFDVVRAGITGGKRTKSFSFNLKGQGEGLKKGAIRAKEIIKTGADSQDLAKAEMHKPLRFGKTPLGRVGQTVTNAVFRTLGAEDKIPFEMNFRRSLEEQAKVIKNNDKLTPQQMRELIESPTEKMLATATKDAAYATFTSENAVNDAIRAAKRAGGGKVSAALDVIMPFTKTPTNVAKATFVDYTPVGFVGEAAKVVKNLVTKQPVDERALAEAFGRAATGTTILALGAELAKRGLISGSSPTSEAERSQWELENKTPNSVFINGKWRNVGRISPMGNLLLLGAVAEETGYDPEKTAFSGIKGFSENSFLRGAAGGLKAITEPDRFADSFVENTIAGYIPNLLSDVAAGVDTADKRDPKGLKERMLVKVPGLGRESVPEKLNALGEVKENERGLLGKMFDLFNSSKPTDDPLINEFKRVGYNLNYVGNAIGGKTLTRAEEREYQELAGKYIKELVPQVIQSDGYSELSTDQQKDLIERAVNSAKTQAREQIKPKLGLIQDESGIAADAAEGDEYGSVSSNIDLTVNKDGKKNITKTFIQDGKLKTVTVDFNINKPELSGDTDFDKKLLSKYKGKVTTEINDVYNLYEAGKLSLTEAKEAIALLEDKYKTGSSGGGGKSKKGAKIDYRQFVKAIKPVKVTVSKSRSKPYKAPTIKAPSVKQPSLKQLKYKGKVMSLRKKK